MDTSTDIKLFWNLIVWMTVGFFFVPMTFAAGVVMMMIGFSTAAFMFIPSDRRINIAQLVVVLGAISVTLVFALSVPKWIF